MFMRSTKISTYIRLFIFIFLMACVTAAVQPVQAASVKIRYNGKTHKNKSKQLAVRLDGKTISKKSYKAIKLKGSYMVNYTDIFKKGAKAKCSYKKKTKKLTISQNGVTLKMKVGSKSVTVNGKKKKLPAAPLSVRYVSKKKTKILVPVNYIAKKLSYTYKKSGSNIELTSPLYLNYDGKNVYYKGVQGKIYYNHKEYTPSALPVIKIAGSMYMPEEVVKNILKLNYQYDAGTGQVKISNEDIGVSFEGKINSNQASVNAQNVTLNAPIKLVKNLKKNVSVVCLPASGVLKQLKYTSSWDSSKKYYKAQSQIFFLWNKKITADPNESATINRLYDFQSKYSQPSANTGSIDFRLTGSSTELMSSLSVRRNKNTITVSLPKSQYMLDKKQFTNFGEIISKMDVTASGDTVEITFDCESVTDYSYVIQNNVLMMNLLYTYSSSNGSVTNYSLSIPKPSGTTISDVTNEDLYASKKFKVMIKGDHVAHFQKNPVVINDNSVKGVEVTKSGNNTVLTISTASLRGYKIYEQGSNFVVTMGSPKSVYKSIVVLDAGHGGHDPGAQNKGTNEKDLNFKIIYTLMKQYFSQNAPDIKVYWTRTSDTFITLANRAAFAKSVEADAFISLHMNSASNASANGTEVYYSTSNNSSGFGGITSQKMATLFKNKLIADLGTKNRGVKTAAYYVLKHNTVPSILIELGFISGNSDYAKLTNAAFQQNAAKSIYNGIVSMFATYPTGR